MKFPKSAYVKTEGILFFARMLDKMRMLLANELPEEYVVKMKTKGCYNSRCLKFLRVSYDNVLEQVRQGKNDEDILNWCFENGRQPDEEEIFVWNQFMEKKGWRDEESKQLEDYKAESGLSHRTDIVTFFDYYDVDEGRKP
ncbi:MAG: DUF5069 domain-containing protein [Candidatus Latescibacteria bacterium]|nr:DUF5069 domain-containing protein [Candidatus Latescibacterota bacterium]